MKKINLVILISFFAFTSVIVAQAKKVEKKHDYMPNKGSFTVSLLAGKSFYGSTKSTGIYGSYDKVGNITGNVTLPALVGNTDLNSNSLTNMVGVEGKYFINNRGFAVTLSLGGMVIYKPEQVNIPEITNGSVTIPGYTAVVGFNKADVYFAPGVQWNFKAKRAPKLAPYYGVSIPVNYGRYTYFNPTVDFETDPSKFVPNYGMKNADYVGLGIQGVFGLDYYLTKTLFIGFDVKPVSFHYSQNSGTPRAGTIARRAEQISYSFFSNYLFKFGFRL